MKKDKSYLWFVIPPLAFAVMMGVIGASMAKGANAVDQVPKLTSRVTPADTAFIRGDTLFTTNMSVLASVLLRASNKVMADTFQSLSPHDTTRIIGTTWADTARVSGRLYFTATKWTTYLDSARVDSLIGQLGRFASGGTSSTNADSLGHIYFDPADPDNDEVIKYNSSTGHFYLATDASGAAGDSNAIVYSTDRVQPYSDTGIYLGGTGDAMMMDFSRADTILAFIGIYYGEGVADSMMMSKHWTEEAIGDSVAGKLDGLNSSNGISGSASEGTANIQLDPAHFVVNEDSVIIFDGGGGGSAKIILNVDGTPTNTNEMTVTENNIEIRSAGSNGLLYLDGYNIERLAHVAIGSILTSGGTSTVPSWQSIKTVIDSLTGTAIPLADSATGAVRSATVKDSWLYGYIDTTRARIPASDTAYAVIYSWLYGVMDTSSAVLQSETGDISNVGVTAPITGGGSSGSVTVGFDWAWLWGFIDSTASKIPFASRADTANLLLGTQGTANTFGRLTGDSIIVDTLFATRGNFTNLKVGSDVFITDITGDGLAVSGSALTASLGTAITSSEITDGTIDSSDIAAQGISVTDLKDTLIATGKLKNGAVTAAKVDSSITLIVANMRTPARSEGTIKSNRFASTDTESTTYINGGQGIQIGSSITLGTDITDSIRRDIQIPEYKSVVYPRGYHATDIAAYDSSRMTIRAGHDATGNYVVCIDSLKMGDDHSRYAVLAFPAPDSVVRLNRILIQASSAENAVDSGVVWAGLKKNSVDSAGLKFQLEDLADRDSTSTSALDTLVLDNTGGLVPEAYTDGDVAYVVIRFTTRAGNGYSGVGTYYIRKAWAEWVRDKL